MKPPHSAGGWHAIAYTWKKAREAGGLRTLYRAMRTRNACKSCALGMGGQRGGMVNEAGHFPEVCKKSLQAMVADMQGAIEPAFWSRYMIGQLQGLTLRCWRRAPAWPSRSSTSAGGSITGRSRMRRRG